METEPPPPKGETGPILVHSPQEGEAGGRGQGGHLGGWPRGRGQTAICGLEEDMSSDAFK